MQNSENKEEKTRLTVFIGKETRGFIEAKAASERRKPSTMAALLLDDLAADHAQKNGEG